MNEPTLRLTGETLTITEDAKRDWSKVYFDEESTDEII